MLSAQAHILFILGELLAQWELQAAFVVYAGRKGEVTFAFMPLICGTTLF